VDSVDPAIHKKDDFIVEFLGEFKSIIENAFSRGSGAQMEVFDEKNRRSNI
jgi:hypothetical protein